MADPRLRRLGLRRRLSQGRPRAEQYTWWPNRGEAWANNVGWRIDYQIATPAIAARAHAAAIYKNRRFSDHAPLIIDYDFDLQVKKSKKVRK